MTAEIIFNYFPELTDTQREQFRQLDALYRDWNAKINVISRKDIDNLYPHHVLHSLGIAQASLALLSLAQSLPLQGAIAAANLPRAMPWAMRLLGLQPAP